MNTLPFISIIIPLYNVEEYIMECLQSITRQTYNGKIECIIVDDCGTDNSVEITKHFISSYNGTIDFKIVHHVLNRGLSAARNTGVDYAKGDYIFFLDSDDYISNDCLELLTYPLKCKDYDMIIGGFDCFGKIYNVGKLTINKKEVLGTEEIFRQFYAIQSIYVMAWNKLIKTSLFRENDLSFLEGQIHEDDLWTYKTTLCVNSIAIQKDVTLYYRMREGSIAFDRKKNILARCESTYQTLLYILKHRIVKDDDAYNLCVFKYMGIFFNYIGENYKINRERYINLRKEISYKPLLSFLRQKISLKELKHHIHYILPANIAWIYLRVKWYKNKNL